MSNIRHNKPMPPLSVLDQVIYWLIFLLLCCFWFAMILGVYALRSYVAFADEQVLAYHDHGSLLWMLIPWMVIFLKTFTPWVIAYEGRKPIFGLKNWKYGQSGYRKIYPLFMKNKHRIQKKQLHGKKPLAMATVILLIVVVCLIPFLWSLYGRDCLKDDGIIEEYSMFNTISKRFVPAQIQRVTIETFTYTTGRYGQNKHCGVRMVLLTESGREYVFDHRDFRDDRPGQISYWLSAMTKLKTRYDPAIVRIEGSDYLQAVIIDRELSENEKDLLLQLFTQ